MIQVVHAVLNLFWSALIGLSGIRIRLLLSPTIMCLRQMLKLRQYRLLQKSGCANRILKNSMTSRVSATLFFPKEVIYHQGNSVLVGIAILQQAARLAPICLGLALLKWRACWRREQYGLRFPRQFSSDGIIS